VVKTNVVIVSTNKYKCCDYFYIKLIVKRKKDSNKPKWLKLNCIFTKVIEMDKMRGD